MSIVLPAFFIFVLGLLALSAVLGFAFAIASFRPRIVRFIAKHEGSGDPIFIFGILGLALSILIPLVAGISYAMSGASWMTQFFGILGQYYWCWNAGAFATGLIMGASIRIPDAPSEQKP